MKYKVIACGVLEHELHAAAGNVGAEIDLEFLPAGLHARPRELRRRVQEVIDRTAAADGYGPALVKAIYDLPARRGPARQVALIFERRDARFAPLDVAH